MQIDSVKQFLFYPLHESHTPAQKLASVIVNIALTCLTAGVYLAIFAAVRLYDHCFQQLPQKESEKPQDSEKLLKDSKKPPTGESSSYTKAEVAKHNKREDCWIIISEKVYDVTKFLDIHPGGVDILVEKAGQDATYSFEAVSHSKSAQIQLKEFFIGNLA